MVIIEQIGFQTLNTNKIFRVYKLYILFLQTWGAPTNFHKNEISQTATQVSNKNKDILWNTVFLINLQAHQPQSI